jgi:hypothetical protein
MTMAFLALAAGLSLAADSPREAEPPHVEWARAMVQGLRRDDTSDRHQGGSVRWKGINGAAGYECHTDCSGFLNALLGRAYGLPDSTFREWFGTRRPSARTYHDAIESQNHFRRITHLRDARPGDVLAIRYPADDPENKDHNTGHVLLVVETPRPRQASAPVVDGTEQWEVAVIDQSRSGHGPWDTRHQKEGGSAAGLGQGVFRVYTRGDGTVAGHAWSTQRKSEYHDQGGRHLVIGRLRVQEKP